MWCMFTHRPMHMRDIWPVTRIEPIMWQLRRQLQESNFGTVRTSSALEYADLRRKDAHIMSETRSCMAVRGESLPKFTSTPCPPGVHMPGARKPNVPHTLGRPCASERSSWAVSHHSVFCAKDGSHECRDNHQIPCCPLRRCSGRCCGFQVLCTVGVLRGWWARARQRSRQK